MSNTTMTKEEFIREDVVKSITHFIETLYIADDYAYVTRQILQRAIDAGFQFPEEAHLFAMAIEFEDGEKVVRMRGAGNSVKLCFPENEFTQLLSTSNKMPDADIMYEYAGQNPRGYTVTTTPLLDQLTRILIDDGRLGAKAALRTAEELVETLNRNVGDYRVIEIRTHEDTFEGSSFLVLYVRYEDADGVIRYGGTVAPLGELETA